MTTPTPKQLQVMYNNFVKISQWLTKKEDAPSPLPPLYADILAELKALRDKVEDLEFKQAANLEEIHYLQGLIERKSAEQGEAIPAPATPSVSEPEPSPTEPEPKPKKQTMAKPSRKKKSEAEEEQPSAPIHTPAPAPLKEQEASASATQGETEAEPSQTETEPLDIELDSTVFTSVSEEVSKILDEINKRNEHSERSSDDD